MSEASVRDTTIDAGVAGDRRDDSPVPTSGGADVEQLSVNTIRTLAMDSVQQAGSGHPGTAMALAPVAYTLWMRHMRYNPENPRWFNRDRFVLSAGHAAILQYALLHLTGYDLPLEELQRFRRSGSMTPGHPENFHTPGVETTTGPLGQGVMNSVGMAIAEAHLAALFNRPGHGIVDHHTYVICSDGDVMEGACHEAASVAGHLGLGKLIWVYDDNRITIDGDTDLTFSEDVGRRFEAYGWHVQNVGDRANELEALDQAFAAGRAERARPSLIIVRSHIGYGAPGKQDTASAHGEPLGEEEIVLAKRFYGWPEDAKFHVPDEVRRHMSAQVARGRALEAEWSVALEDYRAEFPELAADLETRLDGAPPEGWDSSIPSFEPKDGPIATRAASGVVLNALAPSIPWLLGGSADLTGSNKTWLQVSTELSREDPAGRNLYWGIREHVMCSASNGMALHGGVRPFAATFFIFSDYARPAIRLAALMRLPLIYVLTHDSIGLGGDGPTHQPVEHLASFRAMPGLRVIRPGDANEVAEAWRVAIERTDGPTMLVLSRQKIPISDRSELAEARGLRRGAYILSREAGDAPQVILLATGSEVQLALEAQEELGEAGVAARVVSFPSWELFREQSDAYREEVLPASVRARVAIEAGASLGWAEWVGGEGETLTIDRFGTSGSSEDNFRSYGLTAERLVERALHLVGGRESVEG
jgi:transketolase